MSPIGYAMFVARLTFANPSARLDDRSDHQRGLERGDPESGDEPVDPDGLRGMWDGFAHQEADAGEREDEDVRKEASRSRDTEEG